jgi:anaerobic dimethyl sulfoxide reductase subunit B (iron-sulfur subunit)
MVQYGFFFDQSRCRNCGVCSVVCREWNGIPPGPVKWLRLLEWEKGTFPNIGLSVVTAFCYHCENPTCVDAADGAMYKEEKYGAVLIDPDKATSLSLRKAWIACPYGAISFESDAPDAKASMCNMCIGRLEQNHLPICVETCPNRAMDFGPLEDMIKKYGSNRDLEDFPSSAEVKPAVIFKPNPPTKQLIPYNVDRALELLAKRGSLPPVYNTKTDATEITPGLIRRDKPVIKPINVQEFIKSSKNDE